MKKKIFGYIRNPIRLFSQRKRNPLKLNAIEFIEFSTLKPAPLDALFRGLGFSLVYTDEKWGRAFYQQGNVFFLLSFSDNFSRQFARNHGDSVCSIGLRVDNLEETIEFFKESVVDFSYGIAQGLPFLYIAGVGGIRLYLMDKEELPKREMFIKNIKHTLYQVDHIAYNIYNKSAAYYLNQHQIHCSHGAAVSKLLGEIVRAPAFQIA